MKPIFSVIGRLALIGSAAFGIATFSNFTNYRTYWYETIFRVQTVDFNMLAHMLPTKLSQSLIKRDTQEIQQLLDSNYGLFGIVVTNCTLTAEQCPNQRILYRTTSSMRWSQELSAKTLQTAPFDYLHNPVPTLAERGYNDAHDTTWRHNGKTNQGRIIGRVYYIRGIPPTFQADYQRWLTHPTDGGGSHKYYGLTALLFLLGGMSVWLILEIVLYHKRVQKREAIAAQQQADRENRILRRQAQQRVQQINELVAERELFVMRLQNYEREQEERITLANQQIAQLERELQSTLSAQTLKQTQRALQAEIRQREQQIAALKQRLATQTQTASHDTQIMTALKQKLAETVNQQAAAKTQLEQTQTTIQELMLQNSQKDQQLQEMSQLIEQWHQAAEAAKQRELEACRQREDLERSVAVLKQEQAELKQSIQESELLALNSLERSIVTLLESTARFQLGQWLVSTHEDVQPAKGNRQIVDVLLIGQSCVIVIEAKNYSGKIRAAGDPKLTEWFCQTPEGQEIPVNSVGKNPYSQVNFYVDSVMKRLSNEVSAHRVVVYSIVVFAKGADVSRVDNCNGNYSRVTTLDALLQVISELETAAVFRTKHGRPTRSPYQLQDLLYKLPMRRSA
jgi:hypothetical protein